jgi:uncharacterized membrane protein
MSEPAAPEGLEARIAQLEREVAELKRAQDSPRRTAPAPGARPTAQAQAARPAAPPKPAKEPIDWSARAEGMLGKVGVGFLVLALGFLFKYSFDQGWVTPFFRVLLGGVGGVVLLAVGLRLESVRRTYAAILLGGGVAVLYISTYAAYQLYGLIPWIVAFSLMATVTLVALVLSERQDHPSLASLGASGGLATPFLLSSGSDNIVGLVSYAVLILVGAGAVQFRRGWRSLLWVLAFGGVTVMALAADRASGLAQWAVSGGVVVMWAVAAVSPFVRRWMHDQIPEQWPLPVLGKRSGSSVEAFDRLVNRALAITVSIAAVLIAGEAWNWDWEWSGRVLIAVGILFAGVAWALRASDLAHTTAAESAAVLVALGLWVGVPQEWIPILQAALAAGLVWLAIERGMKGLGFIGTALFALLGMWFFVVAFESLGIGRSDWGWLALISQLGAIVVAFLSGSRVSGRGRLFYLVGVHVAMLSWLYSVFEPFDNGQGLVTLAWGVYGVGLLVTSFVLHQKGIQLAGLATLGLVAGKLLLVDMAQLDVIWRILMFLGFGIVFLVLSYFINRKPDPQ